MASIYDFKVTTIDGQEKSLLDYRGQVLLIVNVASKCGLTPQYTDLQKLYEAKQEEGLQILGFPCNQFGAQEPGTNADIKEFCSTNYKVTFPMFEKIDVNGPTQHELYALLTSVNTDPEGEGDIGWNFTKFLIDREGAVIGRFTASSKVDDPELLKRLESALG